MDDILDDKTKFTKIGDVNQHDNTAKNEQKLQKRLLELVHKKVLARGVYDRIRPGADLGYIHWILGSTQKCLATFSNLITVCRFDSISLSPIWYLDGPYFTPVE